ncbi:MAG: CBS domain-containing protein [Candidatus Freyarchaeota archaeon]|nr:CBS domain-containing protein [Candidatus Jordarchaeia archaeon]
MKVEDVARRKLVTCRVDDEIPFVAKLMVDEEVGSVFVEDKSGKIVGLITDGQIFRLVAQRQKLENVKAGDIMTKEVFSIEKDAPLAEAWRLFQSTGVKRLAVTDEGRIVGVLSRKVVQRLMKYKKAASLTRS